MGRDILYSGTVGAAMTAHLMGASAIALSLDAKPGSMHHWDSAAWAVGEGIRIWREQAGPGPVILNVNVPNVPQASLRGAIVTHLSADSFLEAYSFERDAHDGELITLTKRDTVAAPRQAWSDAWAVSHGFVSVTPLSVFPDVLTDTFDATLPQFVRQMPVAADLRS
jgi:5'-nucleotidase